jgi:hypothetical protein
MVFGKMRMDPALLAAARECCQGPCGLFREYQLRALEGPGPEMPKFSEGPMRPRF